MLVGQGGHPQDAIPLIVGLELGLVGAGIFAGGFALGDGIAQPSVVGQNTAILLDLRAAITEVVAVGGRGGKRNRRFAKLLPRM